MRLQFQEKPWDLYAAVGYTVVMTVVLLALRVGNFLAILLVLFVPGYILVAALFPKKTVIDWIERVALSLGLSFAVVPLFGLLLSLTPWGVRSEPIMGTILVFTIGVGYAAYWRRIREPPSMRLAASILLTVPGWHEYSVLDKALTVGLASSIVVASGALAYVVLTPQPGATFTEFYVLGPGGNASGYPTALNVSRPGTVIVSITNHESTGVNYTVRIDLVGVRIVYNATSKSNETVEVNRTTYSWINASLTDGSSWKHLYSFSIRSVGLWKVQFLLFKDGELASAYRALHLYVRVS
jgi:uncharacterized membrane protein